MSVKITDEMKSALQRDAQIPHLPTDLTYECRMAVSGEGPRAYDWSDKPHRLVYDLCRHIEAIEAALAHTAEAEPTAYAEKDGDEWVMYWPDTDGVYEHIRDYPDIHKGGGAIPLYRHPPAPRDDLVAEVERLRAAREWQPMSTAPTNGRHCILAIKDGPFIYSVQGAYGDGQWDCAFRDNVEPLAWMPNVLLPDWAKPWEASALEGRTDA